MLVHMAPKEVAGLQALARAHGGSLTVNPQTGLPEAGFLSSILPMIAGIALGPAGLGLTAMQAGLAAGALGTVATGSLKKGLMAGLGAYGGAGLMGSVTGAGNAAAANMGAAEATAAGDLAARQALVPSGIPAVSPVAPVSPIGGADLYADLAQSHAFMPEPAFSVGAPAAPAAPASYQAGMAPPAFTVEQYVEKAQPILVSGPNGVVAPVGYTYKGATLSVNEVDPVTLLPRSAAPAAPAIPAPATPAPATPVTPMRGAPTYEQMRAAGLSDAEISQSAREYAANIKGTAQAPFSAATQQAMASPASTGLKAIYDKPDLFFNKGNIKYGLAAAAPMMFQEPKSVNAPRDTEQYQYTYNPGREMPPTRAGDVGEFQYFRPSYTRLAAGGGLMDVLPVERMSDMNESFIQRADNGGSVDGYANGGISHLGDYSDGGRLLRGPGDGVSDSIPASIADKRPARLADGEFVVPARIVSELGNGSTDAGARKLYAMMDRVQKNRNKTVGKGKVAVDSRSEKLLPA
jgi:hypothetical protein